MCRIIRWVGDRYAKRRSCDKVAGNEPIDTKTGGCDVGTNRRTAGSEASVCCERSAASARKFGRAHARDCNLSADCGSVRVEPPAAGRQPSRRARKGAAHGRRRCGCRISGFSRLRDPPAARFLAAPSSDAGRPRCRGASLTGNGADSGRSPPPPLPHSGQALATPPVASRGSALTVGPGPRELGMTTRLLAGWFQRFSV